MQAEESKPKRGWFGFGKKKTSKDDASDGTGAG
jgi:hypothetical protein